MNEDVARQLPAQARADVIIVDLQPELLVEGARLVGEQHEMQQHIGMDDEEKGRPHDEEGD
ncbi:hypothetical protein DCG74_28550 [Bradyrhizobium sp. WBAH42]|nr:hypothetical protein [Bradyrhizobium sp. WBAH30]MDD1542625.1 hypothetical protein [Bradyrhizobium sp. WBAH41]MDD1554322.1 hypothetical protein [Bradyrhizobium sp. WBAH23]MDD1562273.1 hypothetical protein [Bradyrhizobium sp. WBAH33]MDD1588567.1 hypothetical protein [Bradyrhizobium sp. WBAH42]NRB85331.1 hypothetical protein [Bradyrhizobium sp. WBAH10]QCJ92073.1 hypothetical protein DAA57_28980 [Bradyrhizobium yuanmingense]